METIVVAAVVIASEFAMPVSFLIDLTPFVGALVIVVVVFPADIGVEVLADAHR